MNSEGNDRHGEFFDTLAKKGVSRRDFMKFCSAMAAALALPAAYGTKIAEAIEKTTKPSVVWLEMQACTGDTESLLRASKPTVGELVLDIISHDYHETVMAAAGSQAEKSLYDVVRNEKGKYIAIVEGSIPAGENGIYCCIGGRSALDIAKDVCGNAAATIAVGNCAWDGGWPAAQPNPTGAMGVKDAVPGIALVNLPGCPMNVENLTAVIVHYLTFKTLPATDSMGRPLFAYGKRIHDNCERRSHFDAGQFVRQWGDEGHRQGWCLYEMGCKGPETFHNCPTVRWNEGTNWPIGSGHGCIGCAAPHFWDKMSPFYKRLPKVPGFGVESTADKVGLGLAAATAAGLAAHGVVRAVRGKPSHEEKTED
jgi:hydrogenase small subunit